MVCGYQDFIKQHRREKQNEVGSQERNTENEYLGLSIKLKGYTSTAEDIHSLYSGYHMADNLV